MKKTKKNTRKDVNNLQMIENDEDGKLKPSYILNIKDKDTRNKSINNLMISAKEGNIHSQYNLGLMYLKGIGIQQDCDKAVYYLQLAAKSRAKQSVGETNSEIPQMHDRGPMRQAITLEDQNSQAKSNCNVEYLYNQHFDYWLEQIAVENQKKPTITASSSTNSDKKIERKVGGDNYLISENEKTNFNDQEAFNATNQPNEKKFVPLLPNLNEKPKGKLDAPNLCIIF